MMLPYNTDFSLSKNCPLENVTKWKVLNKSFQKQPKALLVFSYQAESGVDRENAKDLQHVVQFEVVPLVVYLPVLHKQRQCSPSSVISKREKVKHIIVLMLNDMRDYRY